MIARIAAWSVVLALGAGFYSFGSNFKNPWASMSSVAASPVLSMLPPASDGCSKDCKK